MRWYSSSEHARRGFCGTCESSLFRKHDESDTIAIMAGTLDTPTGLELVEHIFVADAGDYYKLDDGLPWHADHDHDVKFPPSGE